VLRFAFLVPASVSAAASAEGCSQSIYKSPVILRKIYIRARLSKGFVKNSTPYILNEK
jgi:hypothetical protein